MIAPGLVLNSSSTKLVNHHYPVNQTARKQVRKTLASKSMAQKVASAEEDPAKREDTATN